MKSNKNEPSAKRPRIDTDFSSNLKRAHSEISEQIKKDQAFTVHIGNSVLSCCAWQNSSDRIYKHLTTCGQMDDMFCAPVDIAQLKDSNLTCYLFNAGLQHYSVKDFVEEMYSDSTRYSSMEKEQSMEKKHSSMEKEQASSNEQHFSKDQHSKKPCKHSFLSLIRLTWGITLWLDKIKPHLHRLLNSEKSIKEQAQLLFDSLWIVNSECIHENRFSPLHVKSQPNFPVDVKFIPHETFHLDLIREIARCIFNIKVGPLKSKVVSQKIKPLSLFILAIDNNEFLKSLEDFKTICQSAVEWFSKHTDWPEMKWKVDSPMIFVPHRCVEINESEDLAISDFENKLKITGSASWSIFSPEEEEDENKLFMVKPLLISVEWTYKKGLTFKIILTQFANYRRIYNEFDILEDSPEEELTIFYQKLVPAIVEFVGKLANLQKKGIVFPHGSILTRTYIRRSRLNRENLIIDISMYGSDENAVIVDNAYTYFEKKTTIPEGILKILDCSEPFKMNPMKNNVWEFGAWLICLYNTSHNEIIFTHDYMQNMLTNLFTSKRLFLNKFLCSESFLYLISYIMVMHAEERPSFKDITKSPFLQYWSKCDDFYQNYKKSMMDQTFDTEIIKEANEIARIISNADDEYSAFQKPVELHNEWNDLSLASCVKIINAFTSSLSLACGTIPVQRNRREIDVKFFTMGSKDKGVGRGVFREGVTMYCDAVNKCDLFQRDYDGHTNPEDWYTLGLLIGHCVLNNHPMNLNLPPSFYKFMVHGPDNVNFDMKDLEIEDFKTATFYIEMVYMPDSEFENACINMEGCHPLLFGNVNSGTIHMYLMQKIKKHMIGNYDLNNLRALHQGYLLTLPENQPTYYKIWTNFSSTYQEKVKAKDIINMFSIEYYPENLHYNYLCMHRDKEGIFECKFDFCPLKIFADFVYSLEETGELVDIVKFVSGSSSLAKRERGTLHIEIYVKNEPTLPTTKTCINTLELFITPEDTKETFLYRLKYAFQQKYSFGYR
jgi:hypothetical protein